jgi:prevent-host-death family protein
MTRVNLEDAKANLNSLVEQARAGEEVFIEQEGEPVVRLVPVTCTARERTFGSAKGKIWMSDDFDAPLPEELLREFYK